MEHLCQAETKTSSIIFSRTNFCHIHTNLVLKCISAFVNLRVQASFVWLSVGACSAGYTGQNCETEMDECQSSPCENSGSCTDGVSSYNCTCPTEYYGQHCEIGRNRTKTREENRSCFEHKVLYCFFVAQVVPTLYHG